MNSHYFSYSTKESLVYVVRSGGIQIEYNINNNTFSITELTNFKSNSYSLTYHKVSNSLHNERLNWKLNVEIDEMYADRYHYVAQVLGSPLRAEGTFYKICKNDIPTEILFRIEKELVEWIIKLRVAKY